MTAWQLLAEQGGSVWLGKGAPQRWFRHPDGFNVTNAPSSVGKVSYKVSVKENKVNKVGTGQQAATYTVTSDGSAEAVAASWSVRWPGSLSLAGGGEAGERGAGASCSNCAVLATDAARGVVTVKAAGPGAFAVSATWKSAV